MTRRCTPLVLCLLLVTLATLAQAAEEIKWLPGGYEAALKAATGSGKTTLLAFGSAYCEFCDRMNQDVLPDAKLIQLSRSFECARIDADKRDDLVVKYKAYVLPTYLFTDAKGEVIHRFSGYTPAEVFCVYLRTALRLAPAKTELATLQAKADAGTATPQQLARLGRLLRKFDRPAEAARYLTQALAALKPDRPEALLAQLDKAIVDSTRGTQTALGALEGWIVANPKHVERWEAQYQLGMAQATSNQAATAYSTFNTLAKAAPTNDWGILARYQAQILGPEAERPITGG